ncbi:MFS transporter [Bailinhaonella thermotolerans]|uniref:MFS transporter n=1 Tax=Bailinhaonella thermotolerans TaxID=1070861 RepID=A0A3A4A578_9ACTN|nr:MFS transporter [Bailinhaonella thermotolerans]RJL23021.1 MFS transporter [Bailinhaonella thermotolerans]
MASGAGRVLRHRDARLYLAAVLVSGFGSTAMWLVAGVWIKSLTGSSSLAALATFCLWAASPAGPLLGALADRVRRRPLLVAVNAAMAALLPLVLAVRSGGWLWVLFAVLVVYGAASALTDAAEAGLVTAVVPGELLADVNGLRMSVNEGMKLLAPLAGAALFAAYGAAPVVLLDAATFLIAALVYASIRAPEPPPAPRERGGTREGLRFLWRHRELRRLVLAGGGAMLLAGVNGAVIYEVVDAGLGLDPEFTGVLYAAQGAGSIAAGVATGPLLRRLPARVVAAAGIALFAIGVVTRVTPSPAVALAASVVIGLGLPAVLIAVLTEVQRETPSALLGRVAGTANTVVFVPNAVALAAGAGVVAVAGHRPILITLGVAAIPLAVFCARRVPAFAPSSVPGEA